MSLNAAYHVVRAEGSTPATPALYAPNSSGFTYAATAGRHAGAVHMGFGVSRLEPDGYLAMHVHSCEESFYVLSGHPVLTLDGRSHRLEAGVCGLIPIGAPHAWLADADQPARWLEMTAPAPRIDGPPDTFFTGQPAPASPGDAVDIRDPRSRGLFRLDPGQLDVVELKTGAAVDAPTVSASMATALLVYSGIAVKMLVDQRLGAALHTMFMVEYQPGGVAQPHDHPLEESYFILDGEVEAEADGERFTLRAGDAFWTGVGCIHAFYNTSDRTVRWLETSSPQPPSNHSYRFMRDWDYLAAAIALGQARASA